MTGDYATYFVVLYLASLAFAYELRFTEATLQLGRSLSKIKEGTGFQNAITPPFSSKLAIAMYILVVFVLGFGFYQYGIWFGLAVIVLFFLFVLINRLLFIPKPESRHFRNLIVGSMIRRHADYLKNGDQLRANVMAELLESAGIPVNDLVEEIRNRR